MKALKRESPVSIMPRPIKKLTLEKELTKSLSVIMLNRIPDPKAAIIKPKELSVNPRSTVKKVYPRINKAPSANKLRDIDIAIFLIEGVLKK